MTTIFEINEKIVFFFLKYKLICLQYYFSATGCVIISFNINNPKSN